MTSSMQALVYTGPNAMELREIPIPLPRAGEVLVRVAAVGICGSDLHAYHGHDERRPAPLVLGHEAAGTIVTGRGQGERVTINPLVVDPGCPSVRAGRPHLSPTRQIISMPPRPGAFAQYVTIPERNIIPIADALDFNRAALAEPLAVAWHAVRIGAERLGQRFDTASVLIMGGGAIGLAAALVARHRGAKQITVAETNADRRAIIDRQSGLITYDPSREEAPYGVDLVLDAVGAKTTRQTSSQCARPGGVIVHVGLLPGDAGFDIRRITLQEITVTGSYCYTPRDFSETVAAMEAGDLGALDWFEKRSLSLGAKAFSDLDAGLVSAPKIILDPSQ